MTVNEAIRTLRRRCGDTQQTFATELGLSLRAYQKYEQDQMPEPRALIRFMVLTLETHASEDLHRVFARALQQQLDPPRGWKLQISFIRE